MNDVKKRILSLFEIYFNELQEEYKINDDDLYKLKMKLMKEIDEIIVIEKK